jgi:predicted RNA-binding protein with PIN domain
MHYIIDGYNLLFATHLCEQSLEAQREELIQEICEKSEEKNLSITVVFDAHHQQGEASFRKHDQINIIFTAKSQTADEFILHLLETTTDKLHHITVVSSDKAVARNAKSLGAKSIDVLSFIQWLRKKRAPIKEKTIYILPKKIKKTIFKETNKQFYTPEKLFEYYLESFEKKLSPSKSKSNKETKSLFDKERWLEFFERDIETDENY